MSFKIKGFDKLEKQLNQMQKAAEELSNTNTVSFDKLFTCSFMNKYTNFSNFDDLLYAGNFIVNSQEDFEAIPDKEFDIHISSCTKFSTWEEMLNKATELYVSKKLGF